MCVQPNETNVQQINRKQILKEKETKIKGTNQTNVQTQQKKKTIKSKEYQSKESWKKTKKRFQNITKNPKTNKQTNKARKFWKKLEIFCLQTKTFLLFIFDINQNQNILLLVSF